MRRGLFLLIPITLLAFNVGFGETVQDKIREDAKVRALKFDEDVLKLYEGEGKLVGDRPVETAPPTVVKSPKEEVSEESVVKSDLTEIPPSVLRNVVVDRDFKRRILNAEEGLLVSREKTLPMKPVTFVNVHPEVMLTLEYPKEVENVLMSAPGGNVYFRKNSVFVKFPRKGSLYTIKVIFKDGTSASVVAKRVNPLVEKMPTATVIKFYPVKKLTPASALLLFKRLNGYCPQSGDEIAVSGCVYRFRVVDDTFVNKNVVKACGVSYSVKVE